MRDKPTFRELLFYSRKTFVKSKEGVFYTPVNLGKAKAFLIGIFACFCVAPLTIWVLASLNGQLWPTRFIDNLILMNLGSLLCQYPYYRFLRYERIPENSEAYVRASALKYPSKVTIVSRWILGVIYLLLALHSTGAAYIRYWLDGGARITEAIVVIGETETLPLYDEIDIPSEPSVIEIPSFPDNLPASIRVTTSGSPEPMQLTLDGTAATTYELLSAIRQN